MALKLIAHTHKDFADETLRKDWLHLETHGACTPFQTWSYMQQAIRHLPQMVGAETLFVRLVDEETNRPVLILPLEQKQHYGVQRADFLDFWVADHQMPPFDPELLNSSEACEQAYTKLREALQPIDVFGARSMIASWNGVENPLIRFFDEFESGPGSFRLELDENLDKVMKANSVYAKTRKARRRLESDFGIELVEVTDHQDIDRVFDAMISQRAAKFDAMGISDHVGKPQVQTFFRELAKEQAPDGRALVLGFRHEERWIASTFTNALGNVVTGQLFGAEQGPWMKFGPGLVSLLYELEWARDKGATAYDFGAGTDSYKARFGGFKQPHSKAITALTSAGSIYIAALEQKNLARRLRQQAREMRFVPRQFAKLRESLKARG